MNANEMVIIARLATLYEDHGVENPLDNAEHDIRELKRGAPELWRRIYDSEMSDRAIGDWAYDFFMREIQSGMSLKNFAADELEALDKVGTNIPHPVREAIRMNTFKKLPRLQESAPRTYRGFKIAPIDATHLGYWIPGPGGRGVGRSGKGRKMRVFYIYSPEDSDRPIKSVDSMRHAIEYIDNYLGDAPSEMSEHRVADFNTLEDLAEHAARELGATHILYVDDEIHIYFPRQDGLFEKAEVWQKDGYWHAQGPGSRVVVRKLPVGAKPIGRRAGVEAARSHRLTRATAVPGTPVRVVDGDSMYRGEVGRIVAPDASFTAHLDNYNRALLSQGAVLVQRRNGSLFVVLPHTLERENENPIDRRANRAPTAPREAHASRRDGPRQATKPGKHGTLKLWTITYTDRDNPAFGEDSFRTWAYDKEAAALAFNERTEEDGESWEIVKIEPVLDTGPKKLSR